MCVNALASGSGTYKIQGNVHRLVVEFFGVPILFSLSPFCS